MQAGNGILHPCRPLDNFVCNKNKNFISRPKHVWGTHKNRLNETILLGTQKLRRYSLFYTKIFCLSYHMINNQLNIDIIDMIIIRILMGQNVRNPSFGFILLYT